MERPDLTLQYAKAIAAAFDHTHHANQNTLDHGWLGSYQPPPPSQPICPGCGRCQWCGRSNPLQQQPYWGHHYQTTGYMQVTS